MFYAFDLTVPAGTAKRDAVTASARLNKGHVTRVEVMFPAGCAGLVFTVAERGESQVWPTNPDGSFQGDDQVVAWDEDYPLDDEPLTLLLRAWSPDARYSHTITWRFELVSLDQAEAAAATPGLVRRLSEALLGRS